MSTTKENITKKKLLELGRRVINKTRSALFYGSGNVERDLIKTGNWSKAMLDRSKELPRPQYKDEIRNSAVNSAIAVYNRVGNCGEMSDVCIHFLIQEIMQDENLKKEYLDGNIVISRMTFPPPYDHAFIRLDFKAGLKSNITPGLPTQPSTVKQETVYLDAWNKITEKDEYCVFSEENFDAYQSSIGKLLMPNAQNPLRVTPQSLTQELSINMRYSSTLHTRIFDTTFNELALNKSNQVVRDLHDRLMLSVKSQEAESINTYFQQGAVVDKDIVLAAMQSGKSIIIDKILFQVATKSKYYLGEFDDLDERLIKGMSDNHMFLCSDNGNLILLVKHKGELINLFSPNPVTLKMIAEKIVLEFDRQQFHYEHPHDFDQALFSYALSKASILLDPARIQENDSWFMIRNLFYIKDVEEAKSIFENNPQITNNLNIVDLNGDTLFHHFIKQENIPMLQLLLNYAKGERLDFRDRKNKTPLMLAAENNNTAILKILLQNGADPALTVSENSQVKTALILALEKGNREAALLLLNIDNIPEVFLQDKYKESLNPALNTALNPVSSFEKLKANKPSIGSQALKLAQHHGFHDIAEILIKKFNVSPKDELDKSRPPSNALLLSFATKEAHPQLSLKEIAGKQKQSETDSEPDKTDESDPKKPKKDKVVKR